MRFARGAPGLGVPGAFVLGLILALGTPAGVRAGRTAASTAEPAPPTGPSPWERVDGFRIHPDSLGCALRWADDPYPIAADAAESRVFAKAILETWAGPLRDDDLDLFEAGLTVMFAQDGVEPPSAAVVAMTFSTPEHAADFLDRVRAAQAGEQGYEFHESGRTLVFFYRAPSLAEDCAEEIRAQFLRVLPASR